MTREVNNMFSPDSLAFRLACLSLYGRTDAFNEESQNNVIEVIKSRRKFVKTLKGEQLRITNDLCGFVDENELM